MSRPPLPHVPFTTADAARLGYTAKDLSTAVDRGSLCRVLRGVYVPATIEPSPEVRAAATRLAVNVDAVVCDRTAAWLHGVDAMRYAELDLPHVVEVVNLRHHGRSKRPECDGRSRDLRPEDWEVVDGVRRTTATRTALDLACRLRRREAMAALDAFARECGVTTGDLDRLLMRYRRRRGVVQARELVGLLDARAESSGESWMRLEIHDSGLPPPRPQWWVERDGVPTFRLDLAYPRARIAVEYDGAAWHSSPDQRAADRERRSWLRDQGWLVIVLTAESFGDPECARWIHQLREALRERARGR